VLILFSLNWAILIPYYSELNPSELLAGFSGFLMVYVGVLLRREALSPMRVEMSGSGGTATSITLEAGVGFAERSAITFFLFLIAPSLIGLSFPAHATSGFWRIQYTSATISTVITLIGLYAMCSAVRKYLGEKRGWTSLAAIAVLYGFIEVMFTATFLVHPGQDIQATSDYWRFPPGYPMTAPFLVIYGIVKLLFTGIFLFLVVRGNRSEKDRAMTFWDEIIKFFGMLVLSMVGLYHPHTHDGV